MSMTVDGASAGIGGAGIGNYKGVMLCNRPFGGSTASSSKPVPSKQQFHCGKVPEVPGLPQPISQREKYLKRPKKDSVLTKHKKWLADLQKTKESLEMRYLQEIKDKEDEKQRFQDHEREMRQLQISMLKDVKQGDAKDCKVDVSAQEKKEPVNNQINDEKENVSYHADAKNAEVSKSACEKILSKPAWAITEEEAELQKELRQAKEEEELLEFARGLDFDKYIDDMEVNETMERLRKRIVELQRDVDQENQREEDAAQRAARREMLAQLSASESAINEIGKKAPTEEQEALQAAKRLLDEDEEMQNVHSAKSVAIMMQTAKQKIQDMEIQVQKTRCGTDVKPMSPKVHGEPKIVTHEVCEGTRLEQKNALQNLPYMHRNPAV